MSALTLTDPTPAAVDKRADRPWHRAARWIAGGGATAAPAAARDTAPLAATKDETPAAEAPATGLAALHADAEQRFKLVFETASDGLVLCDASGRIQACNAAAAALFGEPSTQLLGIRLADRYQRRSDAGDGARGERLLRRRDGPPLRARVDMNPVRSQGERQFLVRLRNLDVATLPAANADEQRLHTLANYDGVTGLPNRTLFRDRLGLAIERARRSNVSMALMFLDLDRFKVVNDSLGHEVGDRLLAHVAQQLVVCLRKVDSVMRGGAVDSMTVSRLGGDEFTVIAECVGGPADAALVAQRILDALAVPFVVGEEEIVVSASIGISMFPNDDVDLDTLIRHADMAMYRSKSLGRNTFTFFSNDLNVAVSQRLSLEGGLRRAIERDEFALHYQPKADLRTGVVTGVEALIRWRCPSRGMVPPDQFIAVLEDTGLILPVGAWVIRTACAELAAWDAMGLPRLRMAVNMSARQFRHKHLAALVEDTLREFDIEPARLEIELTETLVMEDNEVNRAMLENFARIGVGLAIDDFGTGHSSLSYLKRFRIDTLKIDRSFVSGLPEKGDDIAIASAVVALGHSLQMRVVAEGVETQAQADFLRDMGCHEMQGYLLSRPLPAAEVVPWMLEHRRKLAGARAERAPEISRTMELMPMELMPMASVD